MKTYFFAAVFAAPLLMLSACASLVQGTSQTITFHLQPKEIQCVASRDGVDISPITYDYNTLMVTKGKNDVVILCAAPGYQRKTVRLVSKTQPIGVAGGLFVTPDFGATDMATGAMWRYPSEMTIILQKQ